VLQGQPLEIDQSPVIWAGKEIFHKEGNSYQVVLVLITSFVSRPNWQREWPGNEAARSLHFILFHGSQALVESQYLS